MNASNVSPDELALSRGQLKSRSKDLHGVRFGDLTALRIVATDHRGHLWRFTCAGCGGTAAMHAVDVRRVFAMYGARTACGQCMSEERRGFRSTSMQEALRRLWSERHELYSNTYDEWVARVVRAALEDEFGPEEQRLSESSAYDIQPAAARRKAAHRQQRAAYLYPLDLGHDRVIRCIDCSADVRRAFGCVLCVEPTCVPCVTKSKHACSDDMESSTLTSAGKDFGVSRERIRQIEGRALRRLRHAALGHALDELMRGSPPAVWERKLARSVFNGGAP